MKTLFYLIFFGFLYFTLDAQVDYVISNSDTNVNFYDYAYLSQTYYKIHHLSDSLKHSIFIYQKKISYLNKKQKTLARLLNQYMSMYSSFLKFYYLFKLTYNNPLLFIFSSHSFNLASIRFTFFKFFIDYVNKLKLYISALSLQIKTYNDLLNNHKKILLVLNQEYNSNLLLEDSLFNALTLKSKALQQKSDKIRRFIEKYENSNTLIESMVKNANFTFSQKFDQNMRLISPLPKFTVISSFGLHTHPNFENVTTRNLGIDLFSSSSHTVRAVSDGIVTRVVKIPDYGYTILIRHTNFFTVYSYLSDVLVQQNDTVFKKQDIGFINSAYKYSFPVLNFQIWYNNKPYNPLNFLYKQ